MDTHTPHIPGLPNSPEPPAQLLNVLNTLHHPAISQVGLTTTTDGHWALMVTVKSGTSTPIRKIEKALHDSPVIYQEEMEELPVARPAFPAWGE